MNPNQLSELINLLEIRQTAYRRNLKIVGTILFITIFIMLITGLVFDITQFRSFTIILGINLVILITYLTTWVKYFTAKENITLLQTLLK